MIIATIIAILLLVAYFVVSDRVERSRRESAQLDVNHIERLFFENDIRGAMRYRLLTWGDHHTTVRSMAEGDVDNYHDLLVTI